MVCFNATEVVQKNEQSDIMLYPNPATNELRIDCAPHAHSITVYSITGGRLKTTECVKGTTTIELNDLPAGIYVARITDADGATIGIRKFVKDQ